VGRRNKPGASERGGLRSFYLVLALVAVVGIAALGYAVAGRGGGAVLEPVPVEGLNDPRTLVAKAEGIAMGDPSAPAKLLIFNDFQCPACANFAAQITPFLKAELVDAGKLQIVYHDFPLVNVHPHAFIAARAARCAGEQGKYWEYYSVLFGQQGRWSARPRAPLSDFEDYAAQVGVDRDAFGACLRSERYADVVTANMQLGQQLGVDGTPALILNGRRIREWRGYSDLKRLIEAEAGN
jgi:protein-disulfide isomerase